MQVALWAMTFALLVMSALRTIRRREWHRPLATLVGSAFVFQVLTLGQPPVIVGLVLTSTLAASLWWPRGWGIFPEAAESSASPHQRAA